MSSKIIKDIYGGELKLTSKRLVELDFSDSHEPWAADYSDLARATPRKGVRIYETVKRLGKHYTLIAKFRPPTWKESTGVIGCRIFSRETFSLIIETAKSRTKKAKAAKAAKAGAP